MMRVTCVERKRLKVAVAGIVMPLIKASDPNKERGAIMWLGQCWFGLAFSSRNPMLDTRKGVHSVHQKGGFHFLLHFSEVIEAR